MKKQLLSRDKTCRTHCTFYNDELKSCLIYKGLDYADPSIARRCLDFTDYHKLAKYYEEDNSSNEEIKVGITLDSELIKIIDQEEVSPFYPLVPNYDYSEVISGLEWYVAPNEAFGCWIYNQSKRPIPVLSNSSNKHDNKHKYRSLLPIHNHSISDNLASRVVWCIDEAGYGQYAVIIGNNIEIIAIDDN